MTLQIAWMLYYYYSCAVCGADSGSAKVLALPFAVLTVSVAAILV